MVARCLSKNFFGYAVNLYRCLVQTRLKDGLTLTTAPAKANNFSSESKTDSIPYRGYLFNCSKKGIQPKAGTNESFVKKSDSKTEDLFIIFRFPIYRSSFFLDNRRPYRGSVFPFLALNKLLTRYSTLLRRFPQSHFARKPGSTYIGSIPDALRRDRESYAWKLLAELT